MASSIIDLSEDLTSPFSSSELSYAQSEASSINLNNAHFIKGRLYAYLSYTNPPGSFASFGILLDPVNPGVSVNNIGVIGLPLSERDAKAIIGVCHEATSAGSDKMLADATTKGIWELDADKFHVRNPRWHLALRKIIKKVGSDLGVESGADEIRAEVNKLFVYEEGAISKPHMESGKAPRAFATLAICLPSQHEGGELHITHCGQSMVHETARVPEFAQSYMAWYSDVTHEVMTIKSGYRLVLTYNLVYYPGVAWSAATLGDDKTRLHNIFAGWRNSLVNDTSDCPMILAYILNQGHTKADFSPSQLKDKDNLKARYLKEVCEEAGFYFYLADLHCTFGGCSEEDDSEDSEVRGHDNSNGKGKNVKREASNEGGESGDGRIRAQSTESAHPDTLKLKNVVGIDGTKVAEEASICMGDIIQPNPFAEDLDGEDHSGVGDDEGVISARLYRKKVALLIPQEYHVPFLLGAVENSSAQVQAWLSRVIHSVQTNPSDRVREELVELLENVMELQHARISTKESCRESHSASHVSDGTEEPFPEEIMGEVLKGALLLEHMEHCVRAIELVQGKLPSSVFPELGKAMLSHSSDMKDITSIAVDNQPSIHEKYAALNAMLSAYEEDDLGNVDAPPSPVGEDSLREWVKAKFEEILGKTHKHCVKEDGRALVEIARTCGNRNGVLLRRVLPLVRSHATATAFTITFLNHLFEAYEDSVFARHEVVTVFRDVLGDFALEFLPRPRGTRAGPSPLGVLSTELELVTGEDVAALIGNCLSLDLTKEMDHLLVKITSAAGTVDTSCFSAIFLPLLSTLILDLDVRSIPISTPRFHQFAHGILILYLARHVGPQPREPTSWKRPACGCSRRCTDCNALDQFLADPERKLGRFPLAKPRRDHLQRQLELGGSKCTYGTDEKGLPHELVVTKTDKGWKGAQKAWRGRCREAVKAVKGLAVDGAALRGLLGPNYEELVGWGLKVDGARAAAA
ncbi:hypothetical protein GP486_002644 [Trichoglossum hirsutum]|uniref:Prolyl 4-hydroxylase alpha subunit Fe(2+) 2OG dioxygenase domain-containing protein n=1 Tax=Trichoglossum hirsutum TaxID=265104 RepID=A0A9P8LEU9_9PEZI|nr:hypothetical protein GP486_002644 [Trichoglossum hirsutum]